MAANVDTRMIETRLQRLCGLLRRRLLVTGLARLAAGLLLLVVAGCLLDVLFDLPPVARGLVIATLAGWAARTIYRAIISPLNAAPGVDDMALAVQRSDPRLGDSVVSAVQLGRENPADKTPLGGALLRRAREEAARRAGDVKYEAVLTSRPMRRWLGMAALAVLIAFGAIAPSPLMRLALVRLVDPLTTYPWPRRHSLALTLDGDVQRRGGSYLAASGDQVTVIAASPGQLPPSVSLEARSDGGELWTRPMTRAGEDRFTLIIEKLTQPLTLTATGGDAAPVSISVEVAGRPDVAQARITYHRPAYTGLAPRQGVPDQLDLLALKGSRAELDLTATEDLREVTAHLPEGVRGELTLEESRRVTGWIDLTTSGAWRLEMISTDGFATPPGVGGAIRPLPDQAPLVRLTRPAHDMAVTPRAIIPREIAVDDDYGIARLFLELDQLDGGKSEIDLQTLPAPESDAAATGQIEYADQWDVTPLGLAEGDELRFRAAAADFDTISGPNIGRSPQRTLSIIGKEELLRRQAARIREVAESLDRDREITGEEATRTDRIAEALPAGGTASREQLRELAQSERRIAQVTRDIASQAKKLAGIGETFAMNRMADLPEADKAAQLARAVEQMAATDAQASREASEQASEEGDREAVSQARLAHGALRDRLAELVAGMRGAAGIAALERRARDLARTERELASRMAGAAADALKGENADAAARARELGELQKGAGTRTNLLQRELLSLAGRLAGAGEQSAGQVAQAARTFTASEASRSASQAAEQASSGAFSSASGKAARAAEALDQLAKDLAQARSGDGQAEEDESGPEFELAKKVAAMIKTERAVRGRTVQAGQALEGADAGRVPRPARLHLSGAVRGQQEVTREAEVVRGRLEKDKAFVFTMILDQVRNLSLEVTDRLEEAKADDATLEQEDGIIADLRTLEQALRDLGRARKKARQQGGGGGGQGGGQAPPLVASLAELRVLLHLQGRINRRTEHLDQALKASDPAGAAYRDLAGRSADLADRQARVRQALHTLVKTVTERKAAAEEAKREQEVREKRIEDAENDKQEPGQAGGDDKAPVGPEEE